MVATKISSAEAKLIDAIKDYLSEKGEDINRDGLIDTPERFIKQLNENLRGYNLDPNDFANIPKRQYAQQTTFKTKRNSPPRELQPRPKSQGELFLAGF